MSEDRVKFIDISGMPHKDEEFWPALVIPKSEIDQQIERLADQPKPDNGVRGVKIVHPLSTGPGLGLAPGIDVTVHVLKPGEATEPVRTNAVEIAMCIRGAGVAEIGERELSFAKWDVWNTPSMNAYRYRNTGDDLMVKLTYSNAPLLEKLRVLYVEEDPPVFKVEPSAVEAAREKSLRLKELADDIPLDEPGARLLSYEHLIDPDVVESKPLIWRWQEVSKHLHRIEELGRQKYTGRTIYILYNPATERRNGTNHCFFATIAQMPGGRVDVPHKHTSAAINYYFRGRGRSVVEKQKFEWGEGDLMLSAPGWAAHNHSAIETVNALTIQDHPLHIATESLIWQESLKGPIQKLGGEIGPQTNLDALAATG